MPNISIVIPVYNSKDNLEICLESILHQSYSDFEVVMIDDGSKDSSGEICDKYAAMDQRFCAYHFENSGVATARNRGMSLAKGNWITFVDSDDWIDCDYLESMVAASNSKLEAKVIINTRITVNENDNNISWNFTENSFYLTGSNIELLIANKMPTSMWCFMFKKECLDGISVDANIHFYEDLDFLIQIFRCGYLCVLNNCGGYHYREGSYTHKKLTWKTLTSFDMVDKQIGMGMSDRLAAFLEMKMILSVATVGASDGNFDKKLNKILKNRAKDFCKKLPKHNIRFKSKVIISLIAFSPRGYYFLSRLKNRNKIL